MTKSRILPAVVIVILVGLGLGFPQVLDGRRGEEAAPPLRALPVETLRLELVDSYRVYRDYTGKIVARRKSDLGFERQGKLIDVAVEEGDRVAAGGVLAAQDTRRLEASRQELLARRAQATARLDELIAGPRRETIAAARAQVNELRERLTLAKIRRSRRRRLLSQKVIAAEQFDEAAYNVNTLLAQLDAAQRRLDELLAGTRKEQIRAQRALVQELAARLTSVQIDLKKSILRAPFAGKISKRWVDEGTVVNPGEPVVRLVEDGFLEARVGVPVRAARNLKPGSRQLVQVNQESYRAGVSVLLPELDTMTRTITVVLSLEASAVGRLFPEQVVRLRLPETVKAAGFWLPITALTKGVRGLWSAYGLIEDRPAGGSPEIGTRVFRTERRHVEVLQTQSERVLVRGALRPGDLIVKSGTHRLVAGQLVRPASQPATRAITQR
ncbi:MAG: efflux RND transporter periplasmic adaptor subunit [Nitrospinota bacterium]